MTKNLSMIYVLSLNILILVHLFCNIKDNDISDDRLSMTNLYGQKWQIKYI